MIYIIIIFEGVEVRGIPLLHYQNGAITLPPNVAMKGGYWKNYIWSAINDFNHNVNDISLDHSSLM